MQLEDATDEKTIFALFSDVYFYIYRSIRGNIVLVYREIEHGCVSLALKDRIRITYHIYLNKSPGNN